VQQLQEQVAGLADSQAATDDRYTRVKQDNQALTARIHMLEEHIRELEVRGEERLEEEQRRGRELVARVERERQLEIENYSIRLGAAEREARGLGQEVAGLRAQVAAVRLEKAAVEEALAAGEAALLREREQQLALQEGVAREREEWAVEREANALLVQELSREVETGRRAAEEAARGRGADRGRGGGGGEGAGGEGAARLAEMEAEIRMLKESNRREYARHIVW
jgi:hypothetical protein